MSGLSSSTWAARGALRVSVRAQTLLSSCASVGPLHGMGASKAWSRSGNNSRGTTRERVDSRSVRSIAAAAAAAAAASGGFYGNLARADDDSHNDADDSGGTYWRPIAKRYESMGQVLGQGAFGTVELGKDRSTGKFVAVKSIKLDDVFGDTDRERYEEEKAAAAREANALLLIHASGSQENIMRLEDFIETPDHMYIITELIAGGEMFDWLVSHGAFSERRASTIAKEIACALRFLHVSCEFSHRDIKPENLMFKSKDQDSSVQLVDFGSVAKLGDPALSVQLGTRAYWAPEIAKASEEDRTKSGIDFAAADMYAVGIVLFIMLYGSHPFDPEANLEEDQMLDRIVANDWRFLDEDAVISPCAKDLIGRLLCPDPKERMTAEGMLRHRWIASGNAPSVVINGSQERLLHFQRARKQLRTALLAALIQCHHDDEDQDESLGGHDVFRTAFEAFDRGAKGFITRDDLKDVISDLGGQLSGVDAAEMVMSASKSSPASTSLDDAGGKFGFADCARLLSDVSTRQFEVGDCVFKQGDPSDAFYFIVSGSFDCMVHDSTTQCGTSVVTAHLKPGNFFGEGGLLTGDKRNATITCTHPAKVMVLNKQDFDFMRSTGWVDGGGGHNLCDISRERSMTRFKALMRQAASMNTIDLKYGEDAVRQGELADCVYVINEGEMDVLCDGVSQASLKAGDMFGETGVLTGGTRSATVRCAAESCTLTRLEKRRFLRLMRSNATYQDCILAHSKRASERNGAMQNVQK
eukprot:TRINITY_DN13287_c0_g1_i1.p1 TRINITY_DN13287_c0_g1~~TRINITY_DN13287_c0_g1_i1.p1  ORF type:complete len:755 (+),score=132.57 TRINITY_DN13287_c0_g1_i1:89-2353(+)